jgi:hypothetical protein
MRILVGRRVRTSTIGYSLSVHEGHPERIRQKEKRKDAHDE